MDKSAEYVKMCEKSEEIQALWGIEIIENCSNIVLGTGDYVANYRAKKTGVIIDGVNYDKKEKIFDEVIILSEHDCIKHPELCVWLPRMDQLMKIFENKTTKLSATNTAWRTINLLHEETATENRGLNAYYIQFDTIEKLLLCFVMREMYKKRWDGESETWDGENEL